MFVIITYDIGKKCERKLYEIAYEYLDGVLDLVFECHDVSPNCGE